MAMRGEPGRTSPCEILGAKFRGRAWYKAPELSDDERVCYGTLSWWGCSTNCGSTFLFAEDLDSEERHAYAAALRVVGLPGYAAIFENDSAYERMAGLRSRADTAWSQQIADEIDRLLMQAEAVGDLPDMDETARIIEHWRRRNHILC